MTTSPLLQWVHYLPLPHTHTNTRINHSVSTARTQTNVPQYAHQHFNASFSPHFQARFYEKFISSHSKSQTRAATEKRILERFIPFTNLNSLSQLRPLFTKRWIKILVWNANCLTNSTNNWKSWSCSFQVWNLNFAAIHCRLKFDMTHFVVCRKNSLSQEAVSAHTSKLRFRWLDNIWPTDRWLTAALLCRNINITSSLWWMCYLGSSPWVLIHVLKPGRHISCL